ncbi:MAG: hypothetical protein IJM44_05055 [Ruminococcus sp.]|nr:hypothetical protein [Ruminococcus sp.]
MKLSDLSYITQENIDEACINVTSADMYREVHDFNARMLKFHRMRWQFRIEAWILVFISLVIVPFMTVVNGRDANLFVMTRLTMYFWLNFAIAALYVFCFCFFILHRREYHWRICLLYSLPTLLNREDMFCLMSSAMLAAVCCVLMFVMDKVDTQLKDEVGYPAFVELRITTKTEDVEEPDTELLGFEKYKARGLGDVEIPTLGEVGETLRNNDEL